MIYESSGNDDIDDDDIDDRKDDIDDRKDDIDDRKDDIDDRKDNGYLDDEIIDAIFTLVNLGGVERVILSLGHSIPEQRIAFHAACTLGKLDIVRALVRGSGFQILNIPDMLPIVCSRGNLQMVQYLCEHGADIYQGDPMTRACQSGVFDLVVYLRDRGIDLNSLDGHNGFNIACGDGHLHIIRWMLLHGIDISFRDYEALEYAQADGNIDVVELLLEHGAPTNLLNPGFKEVLLEYQELNPDWVCPECLHDFLNFT